VLSELDPDPNEALRDKVGRWFWVEKRRHGGKEVFVNKI
jgi:hypothetical protein